MPRKNTSAKQKNKVEISPEELAVLKENAIFAEKDGSRFSVRLLVTGGLMSAGQLQEVAVLARRYGDGSVHLTTRQGIEIPHIPYEQLEAFRKTLAKTLLLPAKSGKCVRSVTACPGTYCKFGLIDTQTTAQAVFKKFGKRGGLPHKFKIAVAGCRHCCAKPQENDVGIMGTAGGCVLFVGGMAGKTPRWGDQLPNVLKTRKELLETIGHIIDWYSAHGSVKERFGATIEKFGLNNLLTFLEWKGR